MLHVMSVCVWSSAIWSIEQMNRIAVAHFASCFVLCCNLKQKIGKNRCCCCFQVGLLNDHLFEKELFIRFNVSVFRERLSLFVLRVGCGI